MCIKNKENYIKIACINVSKRETSKKEYKIQALQMITLMNF